MTEDRRRIYEFGGGNAACDELSRVEVGKVKKKSEYPPAMHSALGWCNHWIINQMVKFASHRFQGIAGRSNVEVMYSVYINKDRAQ